MPDTCIFCAIIAGTATSSIVYRDAVCVAFMDIQPVNPGHLLVVPLAHAADLAALEPETGAQLMRVAQRLAAAVRGALGSPALLGNLGRAEGVAKIVRVRFLTGATAMQGPPA